MVIAGAPPSASSSRPTSKYCVRVVRVELLAGTYPASPATTVSSAKKVCSAGDTSRCRALEDVHPAGRAETDDVGQADLGVGDLAVAGLAPQVVAHLPDVGDAGGGDG